MLFICSHLFHSSQSNPKLFHRGWNQPWSLFLHTFTIKAFQPAAGKEGRQAEFIFSCFHVLFTFVRCFLPQQRTRQSLISWPVALYRRTWHSFQSSIMQFLFLYFQILFNLVNDCQRWAAVASLLSCVMSVLLTSLSSWSERHYARSSQSFSVCLFPGKSELRLRMTWSRAALVRMPLWSTADGPLFFPNLHRFTSYCWNILIRHKSGVKSKYSLPLLPTGMREKWIAQHKSHTSLYSTNTTNNNTANIFFIFRFPFLLKSQHG